MLPENNRAHKSDDLIEVPAPTPWPFVIAFGLTLMFAGIVTSLTVSVVGFLIVLLAARGWFHNVFPEPQEELVQVRRTLAPIAASTRRVDHLLPGIESHRVYIPVAVHPYSAGLIAGSIGGIGMAIIACLYGLIAYRSIWYPINLLAAVALPSLAAAGPAALKSFNSTGLILAFIVHGVISSLVGLLYAAILPMMPSRFTAFWGSFLAPVLWTALIASTLDLINPALNSRIDWFWFIASQIAYGLITGYIVAHSKMVETSQPGPLLVRAGIEAPGLMPEEEEE